MSAKEQLINYYRENSNAVFSAVRIQILILVGLSLVVVGPFVLFTLGPIRALLFCGGLSIILCLQVMEANLLWAVIFRNKELFMQELSKKVNRLSETQALQLLNHE